MATCASCGKKVGFFNRYYSKNGSVCKDCFAILEREASEHKSMANEIVCPVCNTSVKRVSEFGEFAQQECPTCSAILKANRTLAQTGIVIGLYIFAVLTMIFGCVFGIVTIFVWAIETEYGMKIQQPTLFVSGCSIIWFSLVVGMILIALGKMVDNSDIQKYYTIAQAKRNSAGNESENKSNSQNNRGQL